MQVAQRIGHPFFFGSGVSRGCAEVSIAFFSVATFGTNARAPQQV
jgi:hypothetical protein